MLNYHSSPIDTDTDAEGRLTISGCNAHTDVCDYRRVLSQACRATAEQLPDILKTKGLRVQILLGDGVTEAWCTALPRVDLAPSRGDASKTRQEGMVASWLD